MVGDHWGVRKPSLTPFVLPCPHPWGDLPIAGYARSRIAFALLSCKVVAMKTRRRASIILSYTWLCATIDQLLLSAPNQLWRATSPLFFFLSSPSAKATGSSSISPVEFWLFCSAWPLCGETPCTSHPTLHTPAESGSQGDHAPTLTALSNKSRIPQLHGSTAPLNLAKREKCEYNGANIHSGPSETASSW